MVVAAAGTASHAQSHDRDPRGQRHLAAILLRGRLGQIVGDLFYLGAQLGLFKDVLSRILNDARFEALQHLDHLPERPCEQLLLQERAPTEGYKSAVRLQMCSNCGL